MVNVFKKFRLAFYVCVLPLLATAMVSAHSWVNSSNTNTDSSAFAADASVQEAISNALTNDEQSVDVPTDVVPKAASPFK